MDLLWIIFIKALKTGHPIRTFYRRHHLRIMEIKQMKDNIMKPQQTLLVFFLLIFVASTALTAAEEPLRLDLNSRDISEVHFTDKNDTQLKLSESATLKLKNITEKNVGKTLSVLYMNEAIVTATIQVVIPSGQIRISRPSDSIREEMEKLQNNRKACP